jgi:hypothetical protein
MHYYHLSADDALVYRAATIELCQRSYRRALESGDLHKAMTSVHHSCWFMVISRGEQSGTVTPEQLRSCMLSWFDRWPPSWLVDAFNVPRDPDPELLERWAAATIRVLRSAGFVTDDPQVQPPIERTTIYRVAPLGYQQDVYWTSGRLREIFYVRLAGITGGQAFAAEIDPPDVLAILARSPHHKSDETAVWVVDSNHLHNVRQID